MKGLTVMNPSVRVLVVETEMVEDGGGARWLG